MEVSEGWTSWLPLWLADAVVMQSYCPVLCFLLT